jgi:A/G-specific adenine glycosylase
MDYGAMLKREVGNHGAKSTQYVKQSKFHGSRRQKRGMIVRVLSEKGSASVKILERCLGISREQILELLQILEKEGFLQVRGEHVMLSPY